MAVLPPELAGARTSAPFVRGVRRLPSSPQAPLPRPGVPRGTDAGSGAPSHPRLPGPCITRARGSAPVSEVAACPWGASPLSCRLPEPPALCDLFPRAPAGSFRPGQHGLFRAPPTWLVCAGRRHAVRASTLRPLPHACVPPPQTSLSPTFRSFLPPGPRPASPAAHNRPRARLCSSLGDLCCPPEGVTRPRPTPTARVSHPRLLSKAPLFVITPPAPTNRALPPGRTQPPPTAVGVDGGAGARGAVVWAACRAARSRALGQLVFEPSRTAPAGRRRVAGLRR